MEFLTSQLHSFSVTGSVPLVPVDVQLEILLADCGLHLSKGGHQVAVVDGPEENDLHHISYGAQRWDSIEEIMQLFMSAFPPLHSIHE